MNTIKELQRINERELQMGVPLESSWHWSHRHSSWVFVGGLDPRLSIGDVLCVLSQFGEIEDVHLVEDEDNPGRSRGFAFVKYEDFRSAVLAVDNLNGTVLMGRTIRVDHKDEYRPPKRKEDGAGAAAGGSAPPAAFRAGHAYEGRARMNEFSVERGQEVYVAGMAGEGVGKEWRSGGKAEEEAEEEEEEVDPMAGRESRERLADRDR